MDPSTSPEKPQLRIAIISACSAGIASTYMAAEALTIAARNRGHHARAETQGTVGIENKISIEEARMMDVLVLAADIKIQGLDRFQGTPVIEVGVAHAIRNADQVIDRIEKEVAN